MFVLKFSLPTGNPSSRQYLPIALRVTVRVTLPCFRQRLRDWYIFYVARQQKPIHVLLWGEGYCVLFFLLAPVFGVRSQGSQYFLSLFTIISVIQSYSSSQRPPFKLTIHLWKLNMILFKLKRSIVQWTDSFLQNKRYSYSNQWIFSEGVFILN